MKITHRAPAAPLTRPASTGPLPAGLAAADKAPRMACCCRLSELLPLVRQAHDAARDARLAGERPSVAA